MQVKMSGEILSGDDGTFGVRFEFTGIPTAARANELAAVVQQAIEDIVSAKGGRVTPRIGAAPAQSGGPRLILPN
jgi:hypothetical protein